MNVLEELAQNGVTPEHGLSALTIENQKQRIKALEKENEILKELNGGKLLAYDQMKEMLEDKAVQINNLQNEITQVSQTNNSIDKIVFNEDLSVFEKVQQIQKLLL